MSNYSWVHSHSYECFNCDVCDNLCKERFFKNHLKSQTHTNNFGKKR